MRRNQPDFAVNFNGSGIFAVGKINFQINHIFGIKKIRYE